MGAQSLGFLFRVHRLDGQAGVAARVGVQYAVGAVQHQRQQVQAGTCTRSDAACCRGDGTPDVLSCAF